MTEELQTADGQLDLDTLSKIITAYAINSDPAFIAHAVFGSAEPQQMAVILKQINSEEFLAIAEASKFQSSMDTPQTLKQVKAAYKIMTAEFRNKFCRDMLKKINHSDEIDSTMEMKSATAALDKLYRLEMALYGQNISTKLSVNVHKHIIEDEVIDIKKYQAKLVILDRKQKRKSMLAARGWDYKHDDIIEPEDATIIDLTPEEMKEQEAENVKSVIASMKDETLPEEAQHFLKPRMG